MAGATVEPGVAAVAVTGTQPTIGLALTIQPGVGALTVTGKTPTVTTPALAAAWEFRWGTQTQRLGYEALIRQLNTAFRQFTHDQDALCHRDKAMTIRGRWRFTALPAVDPAVKGKLWNDGGTLKVSSG